VTDMVGSALIRRHIGRRFVSLRTQAGITQEQAAIALQRARATLGRIEEGDERVRFRDVDVRAMLELYGAGPEESKMLMALTAETRNGRKKSWWHDFTETALPEWFGLYVTLEDSAETIRQYESELIPGVLQTRAYAEEIHRVPAGHTDDEKAKRLVDVRMKRQSVLTRPRAPHLIAILNEAVLRRPVGGATVMAEQLEHLLEITQQTGVSARILPWSAGAHGGMGAACSFFMLDFPADPRTGEPLEPSLVYVDTFTGAMYMNKANEVSAYRLAWEDMERRSLDEAESRKMISEAWKGFTNA
jgi:transcriptional regulator with XRE-family HTH domain